MFLATSSYLKQVIVQNKGASREECISFLKLESQLQQMSKPLNEEQNRSLKIQICTFLKLAHMIAYKQISNLYSIYPPKSWENVIDILALGKC